MITFQNVSKTYQVGDQEVKALDDVSFSTIQRVCGALDFGIMAFPAESRPAKLPADITLSDPG